MDSEEILLGPFLYLCKHPGKEIRSQLIDAFDKWLQVPPVKLTLIRQLVEMLHTASLLIDDVEDGSALRRGVPVAHKIYGIPSTINCANYVYFKALEKTLELQHPDAVKVFTEELLQLHRGQGMEIYWRDSNTCPTEAEYLEMVGNKTGGLLRLAVKLMQLLSDTKLDCVPLVNVLGIHFQIRDDYSNLQSQTYTNHKGFAEDITEGKFSFPVIHSIRSDSNNRELLNIISQKTTDVDLKNYAISLMTKTNSFEYTKSRLKEYEDEARSKIASLGGNSTLENIISLLSDV